MHDWFCFSGPYGANHGIEQHQDAIDHAHDRLNEFKLKNDSFDNFEFCEPFEGYVEDPHSVFMTRAV